jgi:hypothetical protein
MLRRFCVLQRIAATFPGRFSFEEAPETSAGEGPDILGILAMLVSIPVHITDDSPPGRCGKGPFSGRAVRSVGVVARRSRELAMLPARSLCTWDNFRRFAAEFAELEDGLLKNSALPAIVSRGSGAQRPGSLSEFLRRHEPLPLEGARAQHAGLRKEVGVGWSWAQGGD